MTRSFRVFAALMVLSAVFVCAGCLIHDGGHRGEGLVCWNYDVQHHALTNLFVKPFYHRVYNPSNQHEFKHQYPLHWYESTFDGDGVRKLIDSRDFARIRDVNTWGITNSAKAFRRSNAWGALLLANHSLTLNVNGQADVTNVVAYAPFYERPDLVVSNVFYDTSCFSPTGKVTVTLTSELMTAPFIGMKYTRQFSCIGDNIIARDVDSHRVDVFPGFALMRNTDGIRRLSILWNLFRLEENLGTDELNLTVLFLPVYHRDPTDD